MSLSGPKLCLLLCQAQLQEAHATSFVWDEWRPGPLQFDDSSVGTRTKHLNWAVFVTLHVILVVTSGQELPEISEPNT